MNYFDLALNGVSITWIVTNVINHDWGINSAKDIMILLVGASIVFFNVMKGIKAYSQRKK